MIGFVAAIAALMYCGLLLLAIPYVRSLDPPACLAIGFAGGMLIVSIVMFACATLDIDWSRPRLIGALLPAIVGAAILWSRRPPSEESARRRGWIPLGIVIAIAALGAMTARETNGDLMHFWGPKAVHFWIAKTIDTDFLGSPFFFLMHGDYPPLLPLVYAWGATIANGFSWWGALALMPLMLFAAATAFRGIAARAIGVRPASLYALLFASVLALGYEIGPVAGVGEPPLILFLTIAVAALTFAPDDRGAILLASLMLGGAAFTKVEGAAFSAVVIVAFLMTRRRFAAAVLMSIFPALLLGSWIVFAKRHLLLDSYTAKEHIHLQVLPTVLATLAKIASFGTLYIPWLAIVATMAAGAKNWRRAALPLLVTAGSFAAIVFFYVHSREPSYWMASSADRVLLVPLMSLAVASAAMSE
jgi:hypothetical protein